MASLLDLRSAADDLSDVPGVAAPSTTADTSTSGVDVAHAQPNSSAPVSTEQPTALAREVARRGVQTLVAFLPLHESGQWSYYDLLTPGTPWRTDFADLNYHRCHITLLRGMDLLFPGHGFSKVADRWQGHVDARRATCPAR